MTIEIRMNYHIHGNERVCIAGAHINNWQPMQMNPVNVKGCVEDGWWCAKFDIPESCVCNDTARMEYKFVVLRENGQNRWEECNNRTVTVDMPSSSCIYSFVDFWAYPLESKLEVSDKDIVKKKPEPVIEKKVEKKPEPVVEKKVEKKPEPIVEKKVEKKPEPVVEKKVEKKPEPIVEKKVEKKPEPVVEKKVEKKPEPVVEKKPEIKVEPAPEATNKKQPQRGRQVQPDEPPKRETVCLRHVEVKPEVEAPKPTQNHKKSGSIVEECKKVFEPEGTAVEVPQFLRNTRKGPNSAAKLAKYK